MYAPYTCRLSNHATLLVQRAKPILLLLGVACTVPTVCNIIQGSNAFTSCLEICFFRLCR